MPEIFQTIQSVGIGGIFAIIVLKLTFDYLGKKKNNLEYDEIRKDFEMRAAIKSLARNMERQTEILEEMRGDCGDCKGEMMRVSGKLNGRISTGQQ